MAIESEHRVLVREASGEATWDTVLEEDGKVLVFRPYGVDPGVVGVRIALDDLGNLLAQHRAKLPGWVRVHG